LTAIVDPAALCQYACWPLEFSSRRGTQKLRLTLCREKQVSSGGRGDSSTARHAVVVVFRGRSKASLEEADGDPDSTDGASHLTTGQFLHSGRCGSLFVLMCGGYGSRGHWNSPESIVKHVGRGSFEIVGIERPAVHSGQPAMEVDCRRDCHLNKRRPPHVETRQTAEVRPGNIDCGIHQFKEILDCVFPVSHCIPPL
jgi:hypothetical protein